MSREVCLSMGSVGRPFCFWRSRWGDWGCGAGFLLESPAPATEDAPESAGDSLRTLCCATVLLYE
jgi:hypothetical protein